MSEPTRGTFNRSPSLPFRSQHRLQCNLRFDGNPMTPRHVFAFSPAAKPRRAIVSTMIVLIRALSTCK